MQKNGKIFIAFLVVVLAIFAGSFYKAKEQIAERKQDYSDYVDAVNNIEEGTDLQLSMIVMEHLTSKYINTDDMILNKTLGYLKAGQYDKVELTLDKGFETNENLKDDVGLLMVYAEAAYKNNDKEKAKGLIDDAYQLEMTEDQKNRLEELAKEIG